MSWKEPKLLFGFGFGFGFVFASEKKQGTTHCCAEYDQANDDQQADEHDGIGQGHAHGAEQPAQ